ncbi:hypothetical protein ACFYNO_27930 [Kitasatospora sp. NPDC006697]|uniref:hypothetical protein n=1 Tax=Kitasatospora sp. NPDC006697 TaxID=3364020 RepID=UPI0036C40530
MMRRAAALIVTAAAFAAVFSTNSAQAATPTPAKGGVSIAVNDGSSVSHGGVIPNVSTQLSNGVLSFWANPNGNGTYSPNIQYQKTGGGTINAEFYYVADGGQNWDLGGFTQSSGQTRSYQWPARSNPYNCNIYGGLSVVGQGDFLTPQVWAC